MNWLVATSLRLRVLVLAASVVLMIEGIRAARNAPLDVFPEFAPPLVEIQTEAPGLSTEEVESLVSVPLENAVNGTIGLKTLRSKSVLGLSSVVMIFAEGTDLMSARQLVTERLAIAAPRLPAVVKAPVILSPLSSLSRVMKIGVSSKTMSQMEMSELAKWTIRPRLDVDPRRGERGDLGPARPAVPGDGRPRAAPLRRRDPGRRQQGRHRRRGRRRRRVRGHAEPADRRPPPRGDRDDE